MEALLAVLIVILAAACLAVGHLAGRPPQRSCDGLACVGGQRCDGCTNRAEEGA